MLCRSHMLLVAMETQIWSRNSVVYECCLLNGPHGSIGFQQHRPDQWPYAWSNYKSYREGYYQGNPEWHPYWEWLEASDELIVPRLDGLYNEKLSLGNCTFCNFEVFRIGDKYKVPTLGSFQSCKCIINLNPSAKLFHFTRRHASCRLVTPHELWSNPVSTSGVYTHPNLHA